MRNDRISPRRGSWDLTTTEVIGEGWLEDVLLGMTERAERKTTAGAITLTANKASGSGCSPNVIARPTGNVVIVGVLKLEVVNTRTALLVDGVVVVRRQGDGLRERQLTYGLQVFQRTRGPGPDQTARQWKDPEHRWVITKE